MSRRKLRYALVLAVIASIGIAYLLWELNDPTPPGQKFDPSNYRKNLNQLIKQK